MYIIFRILLSAFPGLLLLFLLTSDSIATSQKLIFILAGQSNMSGRGGVFSGVWDEYVHPESYPSPSILRLNSQLNWEEAADPLHYDIDVAKPCGVGPGMPFAKTVESAMPERVLGLVPCAVGGTKIADWARGSRLYEDMVARAKAAVKDGGRGRKRNKIEALVWYQGESDTGTRADAVAYRWRMESFVRSLRVDLEVPELLVIQVAIASSKGKFNEIVRRAQLRLGAEMPNVVTVDARGLPLGGDGRHLSTEGQVQLGKMLAAAYLDHVGRRTHIFL